MDSITHIAIGAAIGELSLGRRVGIKAPIWGAFVATIPDLDGLVGLFLHPTRELFVHRGFSHSILFVLLLSPLLGWVVSRIHRADSVPWYRWSMLVMFVLASHLTLDLFNTYGTGILYPCSGYRFAYDSMAIVDLLLLIPLLLALVVILKSRNSVRLRKGFAWAAIIYAALFVVLSVANKMLIERTAREQLGQQDIQYSRIKTAPLPFTNFLWLIVAEDSLGYHIGYRSNFDRGSIDFRYLERNDYLLDSLISHHYISEIIRFTEGYYAVKVHPDGGYWIYDLRYGSLAFDEWEQWYVFSFPVMVGEDGEVKVGRTHPNRSINMSNAINYFSRVFRGGKSD